MDSNLIGTMLQMNICGESVEGVSFGNYELEYLGVVYRSSKCDTGVGSLDMTFQIRRLTYCKPPSRLLKAGCWTADSRKNSAAVVWFI